MTVDIKINYYIKVTIVRVDTKYLYAWTSCWAYFVFDSDIFLFIFRT